MRLRPGVWAPGFTAKRFMRGKVLQHRKSMPDPFAALFAPYLFFLVLMGNPYTLCYSHINRLTSVKISVEGNAAGYDPTQ